MIKKIQFGMPITIMSGGSKPERMVILYPIKYIMPSDQTTPIKTTNNENITVLNERKKIHKTIAVTKIASNENNYISPDTFFITADRM